MTRLFLAVSLLGATAAAEPPAYVGTPTCPGRGYVPYSYPSIGSCPCDEDRCFLPGRYYSCDDRYEKAFWRRWARAHFHGGSMLDGVPCRCIHPPGRMVTQRCETPHAVMATGVADEGRRDIPPDPGPPHRADGLDAGHLVAPAEEP